MLVAILYFQTSGIFLATPEIGLIKKTVPFTQLSDRFVNFLF